MPATLKADKVKRHKADKVKRHKADKVKRHKAERVDKRASKLHKAPAHRSDQAAPTATAELHGLTHQTPHIDEAALATATTAALAAAHTDYATEASAHVPLLLRQCAMEDVRLASRVAYILATAEGECGFGHPNHARSVPLVEDHNPFSHNPKTNKWSTTNHVSQHNNSADSQDALHTAYFNDAYGHNTDIGNRPGTDDGFTYRGRGFAQLTGRGNYENMTQLLQSRGFRYELDGQIWGGQDGKPIDLLANPDHVHRSPDLAARVLVNGTNEGEFTGRGLSDYLTEERTDFVNARRTVNGTDRAADFARIANRFHAALTAWPTVFGVANRGTRSDG